MDLCNSFNAGFPIGADKQSLAAIGFCGACPKSARKLMLICVWNWENKFVKTVDAHISFTVKIMFSTLLRTTAYSNVIFFLIYKKFVPLKVLYI